MNKSNTKKNNAKLFCPLCQGSKFKTKITTYPLRMFDGKQVNIGRVPVYECSNCQHLVPTKTGADKINRCMETMASLFFKK